MAITWRNVNAPDFSGAARPLESAERGLNATFDRFSGLLKDYNAGQRDSATQAFLDAVYQSRTPEEAEAAMARGGAIDQVRRQFGQLIDRETARTAPQEHLNRTRKQQREGWEYDDALNDRTNDPVFRQIAALHYGGDHEGARRLFADYQGNKGDQLAKIGMEAQFGHENHRDTLKTRAAQRAASASATRANDLRIKQAQQTMDRTANLERWEQIVAANANAAGNKVQSGEWTPEQATAYMHRIREAAGQQEGIGYSGAAKLVEQAGNLINTPGVSYGPQRLQEAAESARQQAAMDHYASSQAEAEGSVDPSKNLETGLEFIRNYVSDPGEQRELQQALAEMSKERLTISTPNGPTEVGIPWSVMRDVLIESSPGNPWSAITPPAWIKRAMDEKSLSGMNPLLGFEGRGSNAIRSMRRLLENPASRARIEKLIQDRAMWEHSSIESGKNPIAK